MHRCFALLPIVGLCLCGCSGKDADGPTSTGDSAVAGADPQGHTPGDPTLNVADHDVPTGDTDGAPEGWNCSAAYYSDVTCDCGCGLADPGCTNGCAEPNCQALDCDYCYDALGQMVPCTPPEGWSCAADTWTDYNCDCGCGVLDRTCDTGGCSEPGCVVQGCRTCHGEGGAVISCAPEGWDCNAAFYTDPSCDCGCALPDLACQGAGCTTAGCSAPACEWCFDGQQSQECPQG